MHEEFQVAQAAFRLRYFASGVLGVVAVLILTSRDTRAQEPNTSLGTLSGLQSVSGQHIELYTDLPLDQPGLASELRDLVRVFDAAMPIWCDFFAVPPTQVSSWKAEAYIMLDKQRFRQAGLIPAEVPDFPYGFQYGDRLWVSEQPSAYYRRHLLLHEGTHWFMSRHFGQNAPPWIMEGLAEWFGTHLWESSSGELKAPLIPENKEQVPYWGRISRIREQLKEGIAPSLEQVMQYDNTAHRSVDAYAWSWAAVVFMVEHPDTQDAFREVLQQPMKPDMTQTRWLFQRLKPRWGFIREEWNAFVTDLEYGWDPQPGLLRISDKPNLLKGRSDVFVVQANRGWQASGLFVRAGTKIEIRAQGSCVVNQTSKPWVSQPEGITLEYYRSNPLAKLLLTIAAPHQEESKTQKLEAWPIGQAGSLVIPRTGELQLRINEASGELLDNSGQFDVLIEAPE